jgi:exopolysaccharide biosynthesis polyprenyl glycosylphosphotransferase
LADVSVAFVTWVLFFYLRKDILNEVAVQSEEYVKIYLGAGVIALFWGLLYYTFGFYHDIFHKSRIKELLHLLNASFWGSIVIFLTTLLDDTGVTNYRLYYNILILYFLLHFGTAAITKLFTISYLKSLIKRGLVSFNCLLVSTAEKVQESKAELEKTNHILGLKFIGYVSPDKKETPPDDDIRYWGHTDDILKIIRRCYIERVVICINPSEHQTIKALTNLLAGSGTKLSVMPDLYQILIGSVKVEHVLGVPLIDIDHDLMPFWQTVVKRWLDMGVSFGVMLFGLPFFLLFMGLTKITSPGPIFFTQERVGKNGKSFKIIKFRSMYVNAEQEGPALATENDPRITAWGKFMRKSRIDELPQFWNVFWGDMSLVGPRPERQFFIDQITQQAPEYRHLHKIKPGITSLGQVRYGYAENLNQMLERLKYDLLYIENMSIANDFIILYFTVFTVFKGKGK